MLVTMQEKHRRRLLEGGVNPVPIGSGRTVGEVILHRYDRVLCENIWLSYF